MNVSLKPKHTEYCEVGLGWYVGYGENIRPLALLRCCECAVFSLGTGWEPWVCDFQETKFPLNNVCISRTLLPIDDLA